MTPQALAPRREKLTIGGPFAGSTPEFGVPVKVGPKTYYLPSGIKVAQATQRGVRLAYVEYRGDIHCLSAEGEISIPADLKPVLMRRYFKPPS